MTGKVTLDECGFEFAHLGINAANKEEALKVASFFELFGMRVNNTPISCFMDQNIEIMYSKGHGTFGHIGFKTTDIHKGLQYFNQLGYETDSDSFMYFPDGRIKLAYIKGEIAGFAVHLSQK